MYHGNRCDQWVLESWFGSITQTCRIPRPKSVDLTLFTFFSLRELRHSMTWVVWYVSLPYLLHERFFVEWFGWHWWYGLLSQCWRLSSKYFPLFFFFRTLLMWRLWKGRGVIRVDRPCRQDGRTDPSHDVDGCRTTETSLFLCGRKSWLSIEEGTPS